MAGRLLLGREHGCLLILKKFSRVKRFRMINFKCMEVRMGQMSVDINICF